MSQHFKNFCVHENEALLQTPFSSLYFHLNSGEIIFQICRSCTPISKEMKTNNFFSMEKNKAGFVLVSESKELLYLFGFVSLN